MKTKLDINGEMEQFVKKIKNKKKLRKFAVNEKSEIRYQDQVGHLETRLSPAMMNSVILSTPFSLNAETVRGFVILSTVPLNASWNFCESTISPSD